MEKEAWEHDWNDVTGLYWRGRRCYWNYLKNKCNKNISSCNILWLFSLLSWKSYNYAAGSILLTPWYTYLHIPVLLTVVWLFHKFSVAVTLKNLHHHHQHYCSTLSQTASIYFLFRLPKRFKSHLQASLICNLHFIHLDTLCFYYPNRQTTIRNKILTEVHKRKIMGIFTMKPVSWKNSDT
jgi:hypothetical protein